MNPEGSNEFEKSEKLDEDDDWWFDYWPEVEVTGSKELLKDGEEKEFIAEDWSENLADPLPVWEKDTMLVIGR